MTFGQVGHILGSNCSSCGLWFFSWIFWSFGLLMMSEVSWLIVGWWLVGWSLSVQIDSSQAVCKDGRVVNMARRYATSTVTSVSHDSHVWATLFWSLGEDVSLSVLWVSRSVAWVVWTHFIGEHWRQFVDSALELVGSLQTFAFNGWRHSPESCGLVGDRLKPFEGRRPCRRW